MPHTRAPANAEERAATLARAEGIVAAYSNYLAHERGLVATTIATYVRTLAAFATFWSVTAREWAAVNEDIVSAYVLRSSLIAITETGAS
jgi:site-specific recombinase XerD